MKAIAGKRVSCHPTTLNNDILSNMSFQILKLPWFLDPLFPPADDDDDLDFFLSLVLPNSLTTISILIVSMALTSDKFDPQVSNDETFPLPGPVIKDGKQSIVSLCISYNQ
jgi:hypothetical protein